MDLFDIILKAIEEAKEPITIAGLFEILQGEDYKLPIKDIRRDVHILIKYGKLEVTPSRKLRIVDLEKTIS